MFLVISDGWIIHNLVDNVKYNVQLSQLYTNYYHAIEYVFEIKVAS
jgi:hypothetical protein